MKKPSRFSRMCLWTLFIFSLSLMLCTAASYGQTPKVIGVAGGGNHTVILKDDGSVWTFGRNDHGQLGCGDIANRATPVRVRDPGGFGYLTGIKAVAAGENHTLALATDGIVWAWGANNLGQLGIGNTEDKTTPVRVHLPVGVQIKALATGYNHNLALATDGTVYAWGNNSNGQSGDNPGTYKTVPNPINGLTNVKSIAAGENHSAALVVNAGIGTVKTWGSSSYGQLGNGKNTDSFAPVSVQNGINGLALAIDAKSITLALDNYVSSTNDYYKGMTITISGGWNGTGTITKYVGSTRKATVTWVDPPKTFAPTGNYMYSISTVNDVTAIACGKDHTLAVTSGGTAWAWGYNGFGQLGDGTTVSQSIPVRVSALSGVVGTNGGEWHSLFLKNDGTAWACGRNDHRQLGNTSAGASAPVQVKGLVAIVGIDAGNSHNLALMPDGKLYAWGSYQYGQIGDSATADSATPLLVETNPLVPTVISTYPVDNARDVVPDKIITVTLSTQIQEGPYYRNIVMDEVTATGSPNNLSISTTIKGSVLTVNHSNLDENKKYRIYIPAYALKDANGNLLEDSYTFSFNTRDNACPTVTATSPKDGAGSGDPGADPAVDVTLPVSATFSEDMDPLTINENTFVLCYDEKDSGGNWKGTYEIKVDGIVTYNAPTQTATFIPINNLLGDTNYRATITNLASDLAGNRLVEAKIFSFTTDNVNDPKPFAIVSHSPGRNETDVVLDKTITVTFSEDIQLQDANKVTLKYADATSPSYSGVSIDDGNKIVRIRFSGNLVNNTADIPALKANITFAANGTNFAALAAGDNVDIIDNTLEITFNTALAGNANKIKIAANSLKDAAGNVLNTETITDPIDTTDYDHPPAYLGVMTDFTDKKKVTLIFGENLVNNTADIKANITFAANGIVFNSLVAGDTVDIVNNTLVVTFSADLNGDTNKIKVAANSLKDAVGNVLDKEIITDQIKFGTDDPPGYLGTIIDVPDNKKVTLYFSEDLENNTIDDAALKANITFASDGVAFNPLAAGDTIAINNNALVVTFNAALAGNANKIKIAANSLKDAAGNVLNTETITDPIDTTDYDHPPAYHGATIDATNRIVTLKFSEDLENNTINIAALKANITFAANGTNFAALAAGDNVAINNNTLVVTFATPLTGNRNKIKIAANSLKDTDNPAHVLGEEVTTDEIVAAEPEIDVGVDAIHEDQLIITLKAGSTLDDSTTYNVTIQKDAVTDKATKVKELANAYSFKFTTVSDNIPPDIEGIYSEGLKLDNYASDIAISSPIVIKFTKSIQECNLAWDNISLKAGDIPVGISKSINGNILTITSLQNLDILTIYTLTLPANCVMDMFENKLAAQEVFIFTTGSQEHIILKAASDVYGIPGKTVEVPVTVENGSGLTGFQFALGYEVSKLKPVGVAPGNGLSFGWQFQYSKDSGRIIVTGYKAQGNAIDKDDPIEVVRISFLILDGVAGGDTLLNFGAYPPSLSGVNMTATTKDGKINIVNRQLGDVNGDGFVNVQDTMLAIKFIMGEQSPEPLQKFAADVNSDGVIDVLDVVQIVNISLGR